MIERGLGDEPEAHTRRAQDAGEREGGLCGSSRGGVGTLPFGNCPGSPIADGRSY